MGGKQERARCMADNPAQSSYEYRKRSLSSLLYLVIAFAEFGLYE